MKTITGINDKVRVLLLPNEDPTKMEIPTYRSIFTNCIAMTRKFSGEKALRLVLIGMTLMDMDPKEDSIELEDQDHALLKEIMSSEGPFNSFIMGQALQQIINAEKN